jgi:hypothetical protein
MAGAAGVWAASAVDGPASGDNAMKIAMEIATRLAMRIARVAHSATVAVCFIAPPFIALSLVMP